MCDLIGREFKRCRENQTALRFLSLGNGWLHPWCGQHPTSLHLDRKRTKLVYRKEALVALQARQDVLDMTQLLAVIRVVAGQDNLSRSPAITRVSDDCANGVVAGRIAPLRQYASKVRHLPRRAIYVGCRWRFVQQREHGTA